MSLPQRHADRVNLVHPRRLAPGWGLLPGLRGELTLGAIQCLQNDLEPARQGRGAIDQLGAQLTHPHQPLLRLGSDPGLGLTAHSLDLIADLGLDRLDPLLSGGDDLPDPVLRVARSIHKPGIVMGTSVVIADPASGGGASLLSTTVSRGGR